MKAILTASSLLINKPGLDNALEVIANNDAIQNVGLHANFADGQPITNFKSKRFLDENGDWNFTKTNQKFNLLTTQERKHFYDEICAQINIALKKNINISHLDSHCHLHTLPCFIDIFIAIALEFRLKLRLAQTYNESNYLKFAYRIHINNKIKSKNIHFSDYFETVDEYLKGKPKPVGLTTELMLHPHFDETAKLIDSVDRTSLESWIRHCKSTPILSCY